MAEPDIGGDGEPPHVAVAVHEEIADDREQVRGASKGCDVETGIGGEGTGGRPGGQDGTKTFRVPGSGGPGAVPAASLRAAAVSRRSRASRRAWPWVVSRWGLP